MKSVCAARIERQQEQSIDYANATYFAYNFSQSNATGTHTTDANGGGFDDENDSNSHAHVCWATLNLADDCDFSSGDGHGTYDGTWQVNNTDANEIDLDNTRLVTLRIHRLRAESCPGPCGDNPHAAGSVSNGTYHNARPDHNTPTNGPQLSGVFSNDTFNRDAYADVNHATRSSPFANLLLNSSEKGQPHDVPAALSQNTVAASHDAKNAERVSAQSPAWRDTASSPATNPPQRRNLHGNWRQRHKASTTSFRDSVLADFAKEQEVEKQPTLLEKLGHSQSDPEPWQVELRQQKSRPFSAPTRLAGKSLSGDVKLQHGLFQELGEKYGNTWSQAIKKDEQSNGSSASFYRQDSPVQSEQGVPTKKKTLLEIYYEAKREADLQKPGLSRQLQFGDMAAVEIHKSGSAA
ncbi:uncharacterized protein ColSpa_07746 [Colletotrichum spaethianum]|uniref:Uncharacterized protein n=1 Tax=Colletotrichum spaethianum TaxID=700344 RepID=A0AA37UN00_9PEZI|nr:uncharacterized protein ColSpa_07746 [Colletotrichum spaethianum]GKT47565.1 hypothetical protein ColSpa_07746 [Colletotrichum spaethianum]